MGTKSQSFALVLVALFLTSIVVLPPNTVKAQSKTIIVPDDFPSIQAAIGNATNGDMIFVRKGNYDGPINDTLKIDKAISLIGEDANSTILNLYPAFDITYQLFYPFYEYTDSISVKANDFVLSNFTIFARIGGNVSIIGDRARIIGNSIFSGSTSETGLSVKGTNCQVAGNTLLGPLFIIGNSNLLFNNTSSSIQMASANNNSVLANNCWGLGIGLSNHSTCSYNVITGNKIVSTTRGSFGIILGSATFNTISKNLIKGMQYGIIQLGATAGSIGSLAPSVNNTFYLNNLIDNMLNNVAVTFTKNFWDNGTKGNYYDNYDGFDRNNDGVGDTPYTINSNNIDHYPLMSPFNIDDISFEFRDLINSAFGFMSSFEVISPQNKIYNLTYVSLNFTVPQSTKLVRYSLDGQENVTVFGNLTIADLANGAHNITIYADDPFGNTQSSEIIVFNKDVPEPFPIIPVLFASIVTIAVAAGLLFYHKRKTKTV